MNAKLTFFQRPLLKNLINPRIVCFCSHNFPAPPPPVRYDVTWRRNKAFGRRNDVNRIRRRHIVLSFSFTSGTSQIELVRRPVCLFLIFGHIDRAAMRPFRGDENATRISRKSSDNNNNKKKNTIQRDSKSTKRQCDGGHRWISIRFRNVIGIRVKMKKKSSCSLFACYSR